MNDLIESSEFGDWLIGEMSATSLLLASVNSTQDWSANKRLQTLGTAKEVLLEFLVLQQAMLEAASEARSRRPRANAPRMRMQNAATRPASIPQEQVRPEFKRS
jgi:hypothetical protein